MQINTVFLSVYVYVCIVHRWVCFEEGKRKMSRFYPERPGWLLLMLIERAIIEHFTLVWVVVKIAWVMVIKGWVVVEADHPQLVWAEPWHVLHNYSMHLASFQYCTLKKLCNGIDVVALTGCARSSLGICASSSGAVAGCLLWKVTKWDYFVDTLFKIIL